MTAQERPAQVAVTPEGRLLWPELFKAVQFGERVGKPKGPFEFSTLILFPTASPEFDALKKAAVAAARKKWPDRQNFQGVSFPFKLGDTKADKMKADNKDGEVYRGMIVLRGHSNRQPSVVDKVGNDIIDPSLVYSGVYGRLNINFKAGDFNGEYVTAYCNHVMITKKGERIGGITAKDAFAGLIDEGSDVTVGANPAEVDVMGITAPATSVDLDDDIPF